MEMAKIRVGVNGYGTIGKRVATAVAAQDDMELVGVTKTRPNFEALSAIRKGYDIYVPDESVKAVADAGVKIAHVLECTLKVQTRKSSLNSVIEHWSLADGMQRAVDPSAGIASSQRVSVQRQFESREPAGVATLTNVVLQLSNVDVFVSLFRDLHFDTIEQVLSFRDELRLGA